MNHTTTLAAMLVLSALTAPAWGAQKCQGSDIANGPFTYGVSGASDTTFMGEVSGAVNTGLTVTAPSPATDGTDPNVFPGQGALNNCAEFATAVIGVIDIDKIADADGILVGPDEVPLDSPLGVKIASAFGGLPYAWSDFPTGDQEEVTISVDNPMVAESDYGTYAVKIAAKADGYGIGVGSGLLYTLRLQPLMQQDVTPPEVSIGEPTLDEVLGITSLKIQAYDPDLPAATGLADLKASIRSAGGAVPEEDILPLDMDKPFVAPPGDVVTADGSYTPRGGDGPDGTNIGTPFFDGFLSGIGNYILNVEATDGAGNVGTATKSFKVDYEVGITKQTGNCSGNPKKLSPDDKCQLQVQFTVNRSLLTSDHADMFDQTVKVVLKDSSDTLIDSNNYGTGSINDDVQYDATAKLYQTKFEFTRGQMAGGSVKVEVLFVDIDGTLVPQGEATLAL